jgi:RNA polymerase sigma-70 factor (ECF subfamily)
LLITLGKIRAGAIRKPHSILAFLRRTAKNVVITHHRTENRYRNLGDQVCQLPGQVENPATRDIDLKIIKCLLQKILNQLSIPRDREILQRFYLYEENKSSICRDFGIKSEHFDRVLYRAKQRVRLMLENQKDVRNMLHDCLGEVKSKTRKPKCQNQP